MADKNKIVVLLGNDGTGKSTLTRIINTQENPSEYYAVERSMDEDNKEILRQAIGAENLERLLTVCTAVDESTLQLTSERTDELTMQVVTNNSNAMLYSKLNEFDIFYVVLDASVEALEKRLKKRDERNEWETPKALFYYRQRFREFSAHYGFPLLDTTHLDIEGVKDELMEIHEHYEEIRDWALNEITSDTVLKRDIERVIETDMEKDNIPPDFYDNFFTTSLNTEAKLRKKLRARWIARSSSDGELRDYMKSESRFDDRFCRLVNEGESKRIYKIITGNPYLKDLAVIVLKSTIYSHSKQATGYIEGLSTVRAKGTRLFLEMMYRNGLCHSYRSINEYGVIISDFIPDVPPTEIVVKKYCEGTDKHSFYDAKNNTSVVLPTGEYVFGPYVRFDWRNPNHINLQTRRSPVESPYYYVVEEFYGKEEFFEQFLSKTDVVVPMGDKAVSEDVMASLINTVETKRQALKMFFTIQYYFSCVGLEVQDICYMINSEGTVFWSEINQDCMRIKSTQEEGLQYDKDIWRTGGSSSKDKILEKWRVFNGIMTEFFQSNPFHKREMLQPTKYPYQITMADTLQDSRLKIPGSYLSLYQDMVFTKRKRRVMVTMDLYNGSPVLVKSGKVVEHHSNHNPLQAYEQISLFPDVLVVDLNGALSGEVERDESQQPPMNNRNLIKFLATKYYIHSGGGLRTIEDVQDVLSSSARRIVIGSKTDDEFIGKIPKDRLIVELSVDSSNNVLTHGRNVNTKTSIFTFMDRMAKQKVEAISITFHSTEGHLNGIPRQQVEDIVAKAPKEIRKIYIAGGVSTIDDLNFLWSLDRVIPQLGSAIWKKTLSIADIYVAMVNFSPEGLIPVIVQDNNGRNKGLVYMDREALRKTCNSRYLHRFSRKFNGVMMKGAESGNVQRVLKMALDCDSDALLVTVDSRYPFCHTGNHSCFSLQTTVKASLGVLSDHIQSKQGTGGYSSKMQENPDLALAKLMEEFWEVVTSTSQHDQINECSDLLVHLLMYLNGKGITIDDVLNEMNRRRWDPRLCSIGPGSTKKEHADAKTVTIAVTPKKYTDKSDNFMLEQLGVKILRPDGRDLQMEYEITDATKYQELFGDKKLVLIPSRPKDMVWLMAFNRIDGAVTYNTVVENFPRVFETKVETPDNDLRLCLISRKEDEIEKTLDRKLLIACEHVKHVHDYLMGQGWDADTFSLDRVIGSSEGYMVNTPNDRYDLCDAIVETGSTLDANNLKIWKVVLNHGEVMIGLYMKK